MNDQIKFAIETGILSGVITSFLIWLIRQLWLLVLSPKLEDYFYSGVLLDGTWTSVYKSKPIVVGTTEHNQEKHMTINISQKGNKIEGTFYAKSEREKVIHGGGTEKKEYTNQYKIEGKIIDNFVIINYKALSRNRTGLGSLVLQITHGGTELNGGVCFVGEGGERVDAIGEMKFKRSI